MPWMRNFWKTRKNSTTGTSESRVMAIMPPQFVTPSEFEYACSSRGSGNFSMSYR